MCLRRKRMKVLLVKCHKKTIFSIFEPIRTEPLELEYLSALLGKAEVEHIIHDSLFGIIILDNKKYSILDVGCGTGQLLREIKAEFNTPGKAYYPCIRTIEEMAKGIFSLESIIKIEMEFYMPSIYLFVLKGNDNENSIDKT
jgi:SAM-dependent methyltransferase